jgi:hypothetical protein
MKYELLHLPHGDEQTRVKYSMLVKQHALTEDEYNYLKIMVKNTSQTGTFFDPMPSQLYGNIQNVADPEEMVVGYIGAYTTEQKRLFILNEELPSVPTGVKCQTTKIGLFDKKNIPAFLIDFIPIATEEDEHSNVYMIGMERPCLDCRLYGTSDKPDFW